MGKGSKPHRTKAKLGRPRKQTIRVDSGRPSRAGAENVRAVALAQPHRAWLPERKRTDQHAESLLGRLYLAELLTQEQYDAGEKWCRLMREYHYLLASPARPVNPLARVAANDPPQDVAEAGASSGSPAETDEDRRDRVLRSIGDVTAELRSIGPVGPSLSALEAVILHDRCLDEYRFSHLVRALNALVRLWKISG